MPATLDHVTIGAADFARSLAFFDAALTPLGLHRVRELVDEEEDDAALEAVAWGPPAESGEAAATAVVWLIDAAQPTRGLHLQLRASSRAEVETFYAAALAAGGASHLAPRRWTPYRRGEFQAIVRDPDGNLIEACAAE